MGTEPPEDDGLPPEDNGLPPEDNGLPPTDNGLPPTDNGLPPTDNGLPPTDAGPMPVDSGVTPGPACAPYVAPPRTEPCPGNPSCGLPSRAQVQVTGNTAALEQYQVKVTLPMAVRAAAGPACDRLVFRTMDNAWAPHFVTNCAMGEVWVRVPRMAANATTLLTLHYGGSTAAAAAQSYDDTFDRVPYRAQGVVGAYTFDEGMGQRTCPAVGPTPFDAYVLDLRYQAQHPELPSPSPPLWSMESAPSILAPTNTAAKFTRNQRSLNFGTVVVRQPVTLEDGGVSRLPDGGVETMPITYRPVNWRSASSAPFNTARQQLTVGVWVRPLSPSNAYLDNFQTVVCYGMPDQPTRAAFWRLPETNPQIENNSIFNPWAIFFRGDAVDDTLYQGNTCVEPCLDVIQYAHITTTEPLTGSSVREPLALPRVHLRPHHDAAHHPAQLLRRPRLQLPRRPRALPAGPGLLPEPDDAGSATCNPCSRATTPRCRAPAAVPDGLRAPVPAGGQGPCIWPPGGAHRSTRPPRWWSAPTSTTASARARHRGAGGRPVHPERARSRRRRCGPTASVGSTAPTRAASASR
jgi:hypothetical protein